MPRRNRPPQRRTRRPRPLSPDYRPDVEERAPRPVVAPPPLGPVTHSADCSDRGNVQTFLGRHGDLMVRCLSCRALAVTEIRGAVR